MPNVNSCLRYRPPAAAGSISVLGTNVRDESPPSTEDSARWGDERIVRAEFLRHLLITLGTPVDICGARVDGDLDLGGASLPSIKLTHCIITGGDVTFAGATFTGTAGFGGATFTGDAGFAGATFTGTAWFHGATFTGDAGFAGATFTGDAGFDDATFTGDARFGFATFTGTAWFDNATFTGTAGFGDATFTGDARFGGATFTGNAWFHGATFTGDARFHGATFTGNAWFDNTTFTGDARFDDATFTGTAWFDDATFTGTAGFDNTTFTGTARFGFATFTGNARFRGASFAVGARMSGCRCRRLELMRTAWSGPMVTGGLVAGRVDVSEAVFDAPVRIELVADVVLGLSLRANHRFHLVLAAGRLDLTDADLAAGSLIEAMELPATDRLVSIPPLFDESGRVAKPSPVMPLHDFLAIILEHYRLDTYLTALVAGRGPARVVSLKRAHVAGVRLSGMDLTQCVFESADGLDGLLISDTCLVQKSTDADPGWRFPRLRRMRATRRVIYDEVVERRRARGVPLDSTIPDEANPRATSVPIPTEASVAMTYRSLRKALEDSKDEPGAADFYYGEMEMRRRSAPLIDRFLLTLYWLTSGYGLRAWRALASLAVVIAVAGWCFTNSDWVRISPTGSVPPVLSPTSAAWPWLFAGQETIALFRPAGTIGVTLVGFGAVVDIAVRVLGPILLALAILAIRNRTKR